MRQTTASQAFHCVTHVLLSLVMIFAVVGCGASKGTPTTQSQATSQLGSNETIRIGLVTALTGGGAIYGQQMKNAAELAVNEINQAGGVLGMKLQLIAEDDKSSPAEAVKSTQKLVSQDKIHAWIGTLNSSTTLASLQILCKMNVPTLVPIAVADKITELGCNNVFRNSPNNSMQVKALADYILHHRKERKFAIVAENTDYGRDLAENFTGHIKAGGAEVLTIEFYNQGDKDFYNQLTKVKSHNPEGLVIAGLVAEGAQIVRQARELGIQAQMFSFGGFMGQQPIELTGPAANGLIHTDYFSPVFGDPIVERFVKLYQEAYGQIPDTYYSAAVYDAVHLIKQAIEKAGRIDPQAIIAQLHQFEDVPAVMGKTTFDEKGQVTRSVWISQIRDGRQVVLYRP